MEVSIVMVSKFRKASVEHSFVQALGDNSAESSEDYSRHEEKKLENAPPLIIHMMQNK